MNVRWRYIQSVATKVLGDNHIVEPPVAVEAIAAKLGVRLDFHEYEDNSISGFFYRSSNELIIGVNKAQAPTRQRFTIAHEIGHCMLHNHKHGHVHMDHVFDVKLRSDESSHGTNVEEIEANSFASNLLMPIKFLKEDFETIGSIDLNDERDEHYLKQIAKRYQVSQLAMHLRLARLGYITL